MNIFRHLDYKKLISDLVDSRKKSDSKYSYAKLAEAIRVQKTYISQVVRGGAQLNSDQAYLAARFFDLSEEETEYLRLLVEWDRTQVQERKKSLLAKIHAIQARQRAVFSGLSEIVVWQSKPTADLQSALSALYAAKQRAAVGADSSSQGARTFCGR